MDSEQIRSMAVIFIILYFVIYFAVKHAIDKSVIGQSLIMREETQKVIIPVSDDEIEKELESDFQSKE
ncbi:hypothetical protein [Solibacillus sp. FSL K6-1523]|uniref:hypothetical protein n=1 Tax=Solibacillus sp. FSL K6-1523 TaxID=2921471 RepID=UPI0030F67A5E